METKKISRKTLTKSFHHWFYGNLTCFSQEHMQTFGYLTSMLPIVEELYDKKEDQEKAMHTYTAFFNTEPQLGSLIVGITAGLEEARANNAEGVDEETINGLRAGLMGPIAGIGDSLVVGTTAFKLRNASGKVYLNLQNQLDNVYPGLLTVLFIVFCWWLMSKKNMSPIKVMLLLVVIALVGVVAGFFNPGLSY